MCLSPSHSSCAAILNLFTFIHSSSSHPGVYNSSVFWELFGSGPLGMTDSHFPLETNRGRRKELEGTCLGLLLSGLTVVASQLTVLLQDTSRCLFGYGCQWREVRDVHRTTQSTVFQNSVFCRYKHVMEFHSVPKVLRPGQYVLYTCNVYVHTVCIR